MNSLVEFFIIFLLLVANGIFAMSEIAVVSARKARLQQLADEGSAKARAALELAVSPNRFLSTVQIGITLVGIFAGAFGGATIANRLATYFSTIPFLAPYATAIGLGIVVAGVTYLSLVIGELVPKRLALNNAERIAANVAGPMRALSALASPLVWLLSKSTDAVLRLLAVQPSSEPSVTEEEIKVLIEQGTQIGIFEEAEQDMIESILLLDERRISLVMVPRPKIISLDIHDSTAEIARKVAGSQLSRFPVVDGDLDNVLGVVQSKDLLAQTMAGQPLDLEPLIRPALFVPESISILKVLDLFKGERTHIALVTDEYGGVEGLVTPTDILENIVGYIPSADDLDEVTAVQREDGSWLIDGMLPIDELKDIFDLEKLPGEDQGNYQTLGGFVISQIGRIPIVGQRFEWGNIRFEIVDMDGRRVDRVLVAQQPATPPDSPGSVSGSGTISNG